MNALMIATTDVTCKNLFVYAENNPVTNKDASGTFVDTVFDVISLIGSVKEALEKKNDPLAWACVVGDAMDVLVPGVSGVGEVIKGVKTVAIAAEAVKTAGKVTGVAEDATKVSKAVGNIIGNVAAIGKSAKKTDVGNIVNNISKSSPYLHKLKIMYQLLRVYIIWTKFVK